LTLLPYVTVDSVKVEPESYACTKVDEVSGKSNAYATADPTDKSRQLVYLTIESLDLIDLTVESNDEAVAAMTLGTGVD
jgi:hypothetical protein